MSDSYNDLNNYIKYFLRSLIAYLWIGLLLFNTRDIWLPYVVPHVLDDIVSNKTYIVR